jgi:hypothetical protein
MVIKDTGNVGIGTTNPQAKLHVNTPNEKFIGTNADYVANSAGSGVLITTGASTGNTYSQIYAFQSGNTAYANLVVPGGNVGIGTTSPTEKLVVQDGKVLAGHTNTRGYGFHDLSNYSYTANTGRLSLVTNGVEAVSIDANQNVGIGLTNPADRLDLYDSDDNVGMYFHTATSGTGGGNGLRVGQNNANAFVWNYEATPLSLATGGTARLIINATGGIRFSTGYGAGTLVTDASGNITVSSGGGAGGPYLPLSAGIGNKITGGLYWATTGTTSYTYSDADAQGLYIETVGSTAALSDMRFQARAAGAGNYSYVKIRPSVQDIQLGTNNSLGLTINSSNQGIFPNNVARS